MLISHTWTRSSTHDRERNYGRDCRQSMMAAFYPGDWLRGSGLSVEDFYRQRLTGDVCG